MKQNDMHERIANQLEVAIWQVAATLKLTDDGCTIPFISRYRKEATGKLDEVAIKNIIDEYTRLVEFDKRKEFVKDAIREAGKLTDELSKRIDTCDSKTELEDIYLPYKPKRRTKAEVARGNGLEPLARIIMAQRTSSVESVAQKYLNKNVADSAAAISGALDIIAEWISESESARNAMRSMFDRGAVLKSKVVKGKEVEGNNFENYFDFSKPLKYVSSHQLLAVRRAEKLGVLKVSITIDTEQAENRLRRIFIHDGGTTGSLIERAIHDSYSRLLAPSIETEYANRSRGTAEDGAISTFSENLRQLLMAAPLAKKRVMAIDPGFRTGCKIVCLDENGMLLHNDNIYPNAPQNAVSESMRKLSQLVEAYKIDAIALGNGTASRETESLLQRMIFPHEVKIYVVSEAGASIYSASKVAREEFPDKDVTVRGAVSIGRRLQDPLAELVKIDPKSIGVGQYQYDVDQQKLRLSLDFVVECCVNQVGVNLNTASKELLTHISGIGEQLAKNIVEYRNQNGAFTSRKELCKVPRLGAKAFEQSAGFLRIPDAVNPLDRTALHPESYAIVERMAKDLKCYTSELISNKQLRALIDVNRYVSAGVGLGTVNEILDELEKPARDPRTKVKIVEFDSNIHELSDLHEGMILNGIITNITQFGAFVDVGVKENGLVHISELSDRRVSSPLDVVSLNQPVKVRVLSVDMERKRVSLSMRNVENS